MRLLIIDDYEPHAEALIDLLETLGHEGLYARTYREAGWLLDLFEFDLAILDFDMPEISGAAVAARLAQRPRPLPALIVSAVTPEGPRLAELGDLPFLPKPVAPRQLGGLLEEFERRRHGSPIVLRASFPLVRRRE